MPDAILILACLLICVGGWVYSEKSCPPREPRE